MDYSSLSGSPLFSGLSGSDINTILSAVHVRIRKYPAGSLIAQSGDPVNSLIIVLNGTVKGEMTDYAGRIIKIEDIPAPGALASAFIFGNRNSFPVNVISVTDSELLILDKAGFLEMLVSDNRILVNFLDMISNRSQFLSEKIKFLNFKTIKSKLAQYILKKAGEDNISIRLELNQSDLADFFGVARPSVARTLKELEQAGLIIAKGKNIQIVNKKGLEELTTD